MLASIITIGDELLIGQVVDTNSAWMAQRLNEASISLHQITSVHDDREHILTALDEAFSRADIVFTTGGLGPTKDDITKHVMCEYFSTTLIEDLRVRAHIHDLYKDRPEALNRLTATQWLVPESATILPNRVGSAPIMVFKKCLGVQEFSSLEEFKIPNSKFLIALPGVPHEMKIAMTEQVLPFISKFIIQNSKFKIVHRTILVHGIPESQLAILIEDWENALPSSIRLAYLPKDGIIRLRLSSYGEATEEQVQEHIDSLLPLISNYILALEDISLEALAGRLLKQQGKTIATAESCTGGRLAAALNAQSGSSAYYMGSVVAYDNSVKTNVLGVSPITLNTEGAVSESTVRQMAEGVRSLLNTDYAIATSGIAGPTGGTVDKPVGTVWIAWATPTATEAQCFHFGASREREQITLRAVTEALVRLVKCLMSKV
ncbi:MAG: CinA family nicotinamide mononucleotide deamidase-related protein [Paludibacteraceae bacterium]|nr:CinA family nicotinamide mononucleotide deamidase-related protein [Paludibacteraceae bacterium]